VIIKEVNILSAAKKDEPILPAKYQHKNIYKIRINFGSDIKTMSKQLF